LLDTQLKDFKTAPAPAANIPFSSELTLYASAKASSSLSARCWRL